MTIQLQQTDTVAVDGVGTSCDNTGNGTGIANAALKATQGGAAGSTTHTVTVGAGVAGACIMFETGAGEPGITSWAAGNYVNRLDVTTGNANLSWSALFLCRVNSSGVSQATVASSLAVGIALTTTGVKSFTISGSSQVANVGDRLYIVIELNNSAGTNQSLSFKADQLIDTPWVAAAVTAVPRRQRPSRAPREPRPYMSWCRLPDYWQILAEIRARRAFGVA